MPTDVYAHCVDGDTLGIIGTFLLFLGAFWQMTVDLVRGSALYAVANEIEREYWLEKNLAKYHRVFVAKVVTFFTPTRSPKQIAEDYAGGDLPERDEILTYEIRAAGWGMVMLGALFAHLEAVTSAEGGRWWVLAILAAMLAVIWGGSFWQKRLVDQFYGGTSTAVPGKDRPARDDEDDDA